MDQDLHGQTFPPGTAPVQPPVQASPSEDTEDMVVQPPAPENNSNDTKNIIVILLLLFVYPLGILGMFLWTKWPRWIKVFITLPFVLSIVAIILFVVFVMTSGRGREYFGKMLGCVQQCKNSQQQDVCMQECFGVPYGSNIKINIEDPVATPGSRFDI
jgi:hypothetical protein